MAVAKEQGAHVTLQARLVCSKQIVEMTGDVRRHLGVQKPAIWLGHGGSVLDLVSTGVTSRHIHGLIATTTSSETGGANDSQFGVPTAANTSISHRHVLSTDAQRSGPCGSVPQLVAGSLRHQGELSVSSGCPGDSKCQLRNSFNILATQARRHKKMLGPVL